MGKDKYENETLIKFALPHDIWFHVDTMSSAHVYLRMKNPITSYEELPAKCVEECAQLTKENSIEGCKKKGVPIIYTWASNLLKEDDMQTGAVSFKNHSLVINMHIEKKNDVLKKIQKTKVEAYPNLEKEYNEYMKQYKKEQEIKKRLEAKQKLEEEKKRKEESDQKKKQWDNYQKDNMELAQSNQEGNAEEDFW